MKVPLSIGRRKQKNTENDKEQKWNAESLLKVRGLHWAWPG